MATSRPLLSPVVVGRDDVLALLARKIGEARAGRGQCLLIAGEAGIGKSRLVGTVIRQAAQAGFRYAKGDINPQDLLVSLMSMAVIRASGSRSAYLAACEVPQPATRIRWPPRIGSAGHRR